jgi:hypothetical protein
VVGLSSASQEELNSTPLRAHLHGAFNTVASSLMNVLLLIFSREFVEKLVQAANKQVTQEDFSSFVSGIEEIVTPKLNSYLGITTPLSAIPRTIEVGDAVPSLQLSDVQAEALNLEQAVPERDGVALPVNIRATAWQEGSSQSTAGRYQLPEGTTVAQLFRVIYGAVNPARYAIRVNDQIVADTDILETGDNFEACPIGRMRDPNNPDLLMDENCCDQRSRLSCCDTY